MAAIFMIRLRSRKKGSLIRVWVGARPVFFKERGKI
jgi:hypothetical protein